MDPSNFRDAWQIRGVPPAKFRLLQEDRTTNKPTMRVVASRDWTRGFHVGDEVPWYGLLDPAVKYSATARDKLYTEDVEYKKWHKLRLDVSLENRLWKEWEERAERWYYQLRLAALPSDFHGTVVAVSSIDGRPIVVEEPWGRGRWIALDLLGPEEPMFHPHLGEGSFNKYALVGNVCGRTVEHGRFWTRWPKPREMNDWMKEFARRHPEWTAIREVVYDYDPEGIERERKLLGLPLGLLQSQYENFSLNLGDRRRPIWLLVGSSHGPEGINSLGLLSLVESLTERLPADECLQRFLEHYSLKIHPLNNPLDYTTLIYRDPWAGPGWRMKNVNPESDGYRVFMGHDIHGNPGTIASIQQGNGRWVEEAVGRAAEQFHDRYLESPPENQYGGPHRLRQRRGRDAPAIAAMHLSEPALPHLQHGYGDARQSHGHLRRRQRSASLGGGPVLWPQPRQALAHAELFHPPGNRRHRHVSLLRDDAPSLGRHPAALFRSGLRGPLVALSSQADVRRDDCHVPQDRQREADRLGVSRRGRRWRPTSHGRPRSAGRPAALPWHAFFPIL